jgi:hypothetical protein
MRLMTLSLGRLFQGFDLLAAVIVEVLRIVAPVIPLPAKLIEVAPERSGERQAL